MYYGICASSEFYEYAKLILILQAGSESEFRSDVMSHDAANWLTTSSLFAKWGHERVLAIIKNTIILFVCPFKIFHKHCFQFL